MNWDFELNPIVVKELRQAVRSRSVPITLMLFLLALGAAMVFSVFLNKDVSVFRPIGHNIFYGFFGLLSAASLLFIPLYVGIRFSQERRADNHDLLFTTGLTPERIIQGKFFCGCYIAGLFFSVCVPFMVFTIFLRGIDLPTIFLSLLFQYVFVCSMLMIAIFIACLPVSNAFRLLLAIPSYLFLLQVGTGFSFFAMNFLRHDMIGSPFSFGYWADVLPAVFLFVAGFGFLYQLSVALISPAASNRMMRVRVYLTLVWLISGGFLFLETIASGDMHSLLAWSYVTLAISVAFLLFTLVGGDDLSFRVRRKIPENGIFRFFLFWFYSGVGSGIAWSLGLFVVTFGVVYYAFEIILYVTFDDFINLLKQAIFFLYCLAYGLTGLFVHRKLFLNWKAVNAAVIATLLPGVIAVVMACYRYASHGFKWPRVVESQYGNVFSFLMEGKYDENFGHLSVAFIWVLLVAGLNAPWFVQQLKEFKRC